MAEKLLFELQADETVLRNEFGVWIQGGLKNRVGQVYLTNQRLLFVNQSPLLVAIYGTLVDKLIRKWLGTIAFNLPLRNISTFEHTTHAFNKKVILFHTPQGELKIGVSTAYEQWEPVLKEAMKRK